MSTVVPNNVKEETIRRIGSNNNYDEDFYRSVVHFMAQFVYKRYEYFHVLLIDDAGIKCGQEIINPFNVFITE